jgi:hypothetical protein
MGGPKLVAEKGNHSFRMQEERTAGAEAQVGFAVLAARLKSCPVTRRSKIRSGLSFSAACQAGNGDSMCQGTACLESAVEAAKSSGEHEGHEQEAHAEDENVRGFAEIETADAADEQVCHEEVEGAPKDIDCGGGQALSWRRGEWALESISGDSVEYAVHD